MNKMKTGNEGDKIIFRCKTHNCDHRFMDYYITGKDVDLHLEAFELKCTKCKRVLRLKKYTENMIIANSKNGIFYV